MLYSDELFLAEPTGKPAFSAGQKQLSTSRFFTQLQVMCERMSPGSVATHTTWLDDEGVLKHSRDSERDLNFTWNLGLQLAMLNDINNYSGIIEEYFNDYKPYICIFK
jgi:1,4-alpha-glucan branching enzyme